MTTTDRTDEATIKALLGEFTDAIRNKDASAASALYADDIVVYDLAPPLRIEGPELHDPARMQEWFDTWSTPIESKPHRLTIRVGGDVAYAFALQHMTGKKTRRRSSRSLVPRHGLLHPTERRLEDRPHAQLGAVRDGRQRARADRPEALTSDPHRYFVRGGPP